ncbi:MAG: GNAT family N-acetyltransferase [Candidatus Thorarchaeota archaeon]
MQITVKPLSEDLIEDFLYYFDEIGFADNPEWSVCYCYYYHFDGNNQKWSKRTRDQNRKASIELIRTGIMQGLLAYFDDKPIGWCNVNSRENFAKSLYKYDSSDSKNKRIAGIVCFLIGHKYRRKGVARELLQHAINSYKKKGFDIIEAYPRTGELSDAHSYRGPVSLYKAEGFTIYKEYKGFLVMRKTLK